MTLEEKIAKLAIGGLVGERAYAHGGGFYVCRPEDMKRQDGVFNDEDDAVAVLAKLRAKAILAVIRAEAQDEGAAGEPVAWAKAVAELEIAEDAYRKVMDGSLTGIPLARYAALQKAVFGVASVWSAHPSPTPAADDDSVRIAVEAINAEINAPLTGPTHGAWDRGRISGLKEALAALKSTAAKEGA